MAGGVAGQDAPRRPPYDACQAWALANGHEIVVAYYDDGISGGKGIEDRPGLAASLVALEDGKRPA